MYIILIYFPGLFHLIFKENLWLLVSPEQVCPKVNEKNAFIVRGGIHV
jgi:hypothetical protein